VPADVAVAVFDPDGDVVAAELVVLAATGVLGAEEVALGDAVRPTSGDESVEMKLENAERDRCGESRLVVGAGAGTGEFVVDASLLESWACSSSSFALLLLVISSGACSSMARCVNPENDRVRDRIQHFVSSFRSILHCRRTHSTHSSSYIRWSRRCVRWIRCLSLAGTKCSHECMPALVSFPQYTTRPITIPIRSTPHRAVQPLSDSRPL